MRLRTLPVSISGVLVACAYAITDNNFKWAPATLCLIFAILAQVASNFANEYFDYKGGLDRVGREGPRRGVTEGDISPRAMLRATILALTITCAIGCSLIYCGGWILLPIGITIAIGVLAYSTGPFPLSHYGLGEIAVIAFFGVIPVNMTYYIQTLQWDPAVLYSSLSIGLMGANVLIINNYRDIDDDKAVGKHTLAVILGRRAMTTLYLFNGWIAVAMMTPIWSTLGTWRWTFPCIYAATHTLLWFLLLSRHGSRLNPMLGATSLAMLFYCLGLLLSTLFPPF